MTSRIAQTRLKAALLGLMLVLLMPVFAQAAKAQLSIALKSLLWQANLMYLSKFPTTVDKIVNEDPVTFASILGVTLQRQGTYAKSNPYYVDNYWALRKECYALLSLVARQKKNTNPKNGNPMTGAELKTQFLRGLQGEANIFFIDKFDINPATVNLPMILDQVGPPMHQGTSMGPRSALPVREESSGITLIGETVSNSQLLRYWTYNRNTGRVTDSYYKANSGGFSSAAQANTVIMGELHG